eukprot:SAG11_NODE_1876_length_4137_cov_1.429916_3_plen_271_part_00
MWSHIWLRSLAHTSVAGRSSLADVLASEIGGAAMYRHLEIVTQIGVNLERECIRDIPYHLSCKPAIYLSCVVTQIFCALGVLAMTHGAVRHAAESKLTFDRLRTSNPHFANWYAHTSTQWAKVASTEAAQVGAEMKVLRTRTRELATKAKTEELTQREQEEIDVKDKQLRKLQIMHTFWRRPRAPPDLLKNPFTRVIRLSTIIGDMIKALLKAGDGSGGYPLELRRLENCSASLDQLSGVLSDPTLDMLARFETDFHPCSRVRISGCFRD